MGGVALFLAGASALAWLILACFRNGFWRCDQKLPAHTDPPDRWPSVVALVPARNEENTIAECLKSLAAQSYEGTFSVVIINDNSTDRTSSVARQAARASGVKPQVWIIDAPPLEPGWAGKLWALQHGIDALPTGAEAPDYLWLSDADVVHPTDALSRLVAKAERDGLAMASLMVRLACESFWERLLVPAFIFFFQMLYPFRAINNPESKVAGAAGGCVILKRTALRGAGGLTALKDRLIDDCALAQIIKHDGNRIWLGLAENSASLRRYLELSEFWHMVSRSAFVQLRFSNALLALSILGMLIAFIAAPVVALTYPLHGSLAAALIACASWLAMTLCLVPCLRYHKLNVAYGLLFPVAAALYLGMTVHSALRHWSGAGSDWKSRSYAPK